MKLYILFFISLISLPLSAEVSINTSEILHRYQPQNAITKAEAELSFWKEKYTQTAGQENTYAIKMAMAHETLFTLTGGIEELKQSEYLLTTALKKEVLNKPGVQRMLAKNLISQHRFCEALDLVLSARQSGRDVSAADLMLFDIYMELGEKAIAIEHLEEIDEKHSFNYLIRLAKYQDHEGQLNNAIALLEKAKVKATNSKNRVQLSWIYSNLGDFYGHQGNYEKSKAHFIKALDINPADWYSLKGLAYMSWSLNNDEATAQQLINTIQLYNVSPSTGWLKYEILQSEDHPSAQMEKAQVIEEVSKDTYGAMYNHLLYEDALEQKDYQQTILIAQQEVNARPTSQSYALLAHALYKDKQMAQAIEIAQTHVLGHTYEPAALLLIYPIFIDNTVVYTQLKEELQNASYELGHNAYRDFMAL